MYYLYVSSQCQMDNDSYSDSLYDEEDIISYGEVIPLNVTESDSQDFAQS